MKRPRINSARSLIAMDKYEEPLRGLDYEGGVLIPYLSEYCETRFLMGGYHYFPKDDKALNGIKGRVEIRPIKGVTLNLELKHDNYKDTNFYVEGVISIPLDEMNIFSICDTLSLPSFSTYSFFILKYSTLSFL